jgi:rhodanese-related sulfurtransferase
MCKSMGSRVLWQSSLIITLAFLVSLTLNRLRSDGIPLVEDWSPETKGALETEGSLEIAIEDAVALFFSQTAVFLDARSPEQYQQGHIQGARNLPWESVDEYCDAVMADIPQDAMIITYCDGESCELSKELAVDLFYYGYENIRVLVDGWRLWKERHLPTESLSPKTSNNQVERR